MEQPPPGAEGHWYFSQAFQELLGRAASQPSTAMFELVGRTALQLKADAEGSPRGVTSLSGPEPLVDKEQLPEAVTYHHTLHDHWGEPHGSDSCKELESNPDYVSDYIGDDV